MIPNNNNTIIIKHNDLNIIKLFVNYNNDL